MKTLIIDYWHFKKFPDLEWEHNSEYPYSKELQNSIINQCLDKGYSVMVRPMDTNKGWLKNGVLILIDKGIFGQE